MGRRNKLKSEWSHQMDFLYKEFKQQQRLSNYLIQIQSIIIMMRSPRINQQASTAHSRRDLKIPLEGGVGSAQSIPSGRHNSQPRSSASLQGQNMVGLKMKRLSKLQGVLTTTTGQQSSSYQPQQPQPQAQNQLQFNSPNQQQQQNGVLYNERYHYISGDMNPYTNQQINMIGAPSQPSAVPQQYFRQGGGNGGALTSLGISSQHHPGTTLTTNYQTTINPSYSNSNPPSTQQAAAAFSTINHYNGGSAGGQSSKDFANNNNQAQTIQHPQLPQQTLVAITTFGFDPSDRSTTAGTTLPHLQTTKNSFKFVRHRGSGAMNLTGNQNQGAAGAGQQMPGNDLLSGGPIGGGIIQFNVGMPTLAQVQTIGSITQQKMKLRTIPRRTQKISHISAQSQQASNSSATDDEHHHQSQSRQNKAFMQVSGEKLSIGGGGGQSSFNNPAGVNGGPVRSSPLEFLKSDPKPHASSSSQQQHLAGALAVNHSGNSILDRLSQNQLPPTHPPVGGAMHIQQEDRNGSPILLPLQLKNRPQYIPAVLANMADISPIQSASKQYVQAVNSINPSQFYTNQVMTTDNFDVVASSLVVSQQVNRDIKIRKLTPSGSALGKATLRLQQAQNAGNPSPLTITSFSSQGLFSNSAQNHGQVQSIIQRNLVEGDFSQELTAAKRKLEDQYKMPLSTADSPKATAASSLIQQNMIIGSNIFPKKNGDKLGIYSGEKSDQRLAAPRGAVPSDSRIRKFTSHTKYSQNASKVGTNQLQSSDIRQLSSIKQGPAGFSSIPNFIQQNNSSQQSLSNTFVPNKRNSNESNARQSPYDLNAVVDDLSQNNSTVLHLESYDQIQSPDIIGNKNGSANFGRIGEPSSFMDDVLVGSSEIKGNSILQQQFLKPKDLEISGFDQEELRIEKSPLQITQPYIEDQANDIESNMLNSDLAGFVDTSSLIQQHQPPLEDEEELHVLSQSPKILQGAQNSGAQNHLAVIEEENHDETNKSVQSRRKEGNNSIMQSNSTLSSGTKNPQNNKKLNDLSMQLSYGGGNLNNSLDQGSEIYSKFIYMKKTNTEFQKLLHKIEKEFNPLEDQLLTEELKQNIDSLANLSNGGQNELTIDDIKRCLITKKKIDQRREWFQKKKLERMAQESSGILSRSNDQITFSKSINKEGTLLMTQSAIEENIVVANNLSNSMVSLNNSLSHAPVGGFKFGNGGQQSLYDRAVAARKAQGKMGPQKLQARADYVLGESDIQVGDSSSGGDGIMAKTLKFSSPIAGIDSSGSDVPIVLSKKNSSQESRSQSGSKGGKNINELKRNQYSQRHQSNQQKILSALAQGTNQVNQKGGGSNANYTSSNSLVNNVLNTSKGNKVKSWNQPNTSQDGISSQKSDPNQNRLNKLSSGSDSYYIPQSGESFHYQPIPKTFTQRQTKSLVRPGILQQNHPNSGINPLQDPNGSSSGSGTKVFNEVMTGQKAVLTDRIAAPVSEKINGSLLKWREIKKLGQGTSGEVYLVQNILKNAQPQFFVVKKLQIFSINSGIDKEAIVKLRKEIEVYKKLVHENIVKYIGSDVVTTQFCIYLEYMSGGTIQANYQQHPKLKLPEKQVKLYTKQILTGLAFLHENRVVHGDLKCANVLVDETRKVVKLTDFGSAKLVESSISQSELNCIIRGSPAWMAPEVLNNKGIRRKADIWSLGCCVIEMALGGNPWGNEIANLDNNYQALLMIMDPTKSPQIPTDVSLECQDFIRKCLTREYEKRPTAKELLVHPWILAEDKKAPTITPQQLKEHIV